MKQTGLVLEGGGMRGVFTCGVLDCFMEKGIEFPYAIGVSAGACNGLSYMSHQQGRAKFSNIDMLAKYHYIGLKYLWFQRSILDQHLLYKEFPEKILPYDYDAYFRNPARFEMVTTNCVTGRACYLEEKHDKERLLAIVKASSSLPYVCPITWVDGRNGLSVKDMRRMWWCSPATVDTANRRKTSVCPASYIPVIPVCVSC